ncbi:MAG TPA: LptF/LptG family permease, partial [Acetobacteraceae bacterium]|nr:LptF/LptG family permease [Acetobacteraceae bacterium]
LSLRVFIELTALMIPGFTAVILPITTFVVVQFIYQRLAGDRELTVMRAAGLSQWALARPALMLGMISLCLCLVLNLYVVPVSSEAFRRYQFEIRNRVAAFLLQEGVFTALSDQLTVYVRSRDSNGTLRGILVEDDRQPNSRATILAESGRLLPDSGAPRVLLLNGSREEIDRKTGRLDVLTFAEDVIDLASSSKNGGQELRDVNELGLGELLHPNPATVRPQDIGKYLVEAHRRLTQPITAVGFTLVALASVLTGGFRRYGNVARPAAAVGVMVGLLALGLAVSSLATRNPSMVPLIWVQVILPGLAAAAMLFLPNAAERAFRVSPHVAGSPTVSAGE